MAETPNVLRVSEQSSLTTIGKRTVSLRGWRFVDAEEHLRSHVTGKPSKKWCDPECMARTIFQRSTQANRQAVRDRIAKTFRSLLDRGLFLAIEYKTEPHRMITAFKLLETTEGSEIQAAREQVERMRMRREVSQENYEKALGLIGYKPTATP